MNFNEEIYQKYLSELKEAILKRYHASGRKASGRFESEMEEEVTDTSMRLSGSPHSYFVEKGRNAGKFPPRKAIEEWIDKKEGLPAIFREKKKSFAFLIARKIAQQGTDGSDILESEIQEFMEKKLFKMLDELGDAYAVRIQNDVVRLIKSFAK